VKHDTIIMIDSCQ